MADFYVILIWRTAFHLLMQDRGIHSPHNILGRQHFKHVLHLMCGAGKAEPSLFEVEDEEPTLVILRPR